MLHDDPVTGSSFKCYVDRAEALGGPHAVKHGDRPTLQDHPKRGEHDGDPSRRFDL